MNNELIKKIGTALKSLEKACPLDYMEISSLTDGAITLLFSQTFNEKIQPKTMESLQTSGQFAPDKIETRHEIPGDQSNNDTFSLIYTIHSGEAVRVFFLVQRRVAFDDSDKAVLTLAYQMIAAMGDIIFSDQTAGNSEVKYKEELIKMRNAQARLFPKFENLKNLDVAAIYLPTDLMTGDFVDAFFLNDHTYQIVACDMSGQDASSSFAGAAVRTLVHTYSSATTIPSALIELINNRLNKIISGISSLLFLTVYQINTATGRSTISSYGDINTIFYSIAKKGFVNLNLTETGKSLSKKVVYKDISLNLDPGDTMLFYTRSVKDAKTEDKKAVYGEDRLIKNFMSTMESSPLEIVHALTETVYEFTNYSQKSGDIILMCIRKT